MTTTRAIGPLGTAARALVGAVLTVIAVAWAGISWWDVAAALVLLPAVAVAVAAVLDAAVATIVVVFGLSVALTYVSPVDGGAVWLFFGLSMLLAAARGYAGCEILALPNLLLGRHDAIWCPLYSPVDAAERADARREC